MILYSSAVVGGREGKGGGGDGMGIMGASGLHIPMARKVCIVRAGGLN